MLKNVVTNGHGPPNFPRNLLHPFTKLKIEAAISLRKCEPVYQTTCCHFTNSCSLRTHLVENLKSHNVGNAHFGTTLGDL